jgi:DNA-binding GntR family transcriptional regulator
VNPIKTLKVKLKGMKKFRDRIPDEVLKEIFPRKFKKSLASETVYTQLKQMILSGKLKKKQKLYYQKIVQDFNVSREVAQRIISQLNKDGLIISKRGVGSFIV